MKTGSLILALALSIAQSAIPQQPQDASEPTMQETAQWIETNLMRGGGKYFVDLGRVPPCCAFQEVYQQAAVNNCVLTLSSQMYMPNDGGQFDEYALRRAEIPLGDISTIKLNSDTGTPQQNILLYMTSQSIRVHTHYSDAKAYPNPTYDSQTSNIRLVFSQQDKDNVDLATRMAKALTHARDLCKASYNPHPGEPF